MSTRKASIRRNYQTLWNWWRLKAASFSPELLVVMGIILFVFIGLIAYATGRMHLATSAQNNASAINGVEHNKLAIPFLWSIGSALVTLYLTVIDARIKKKQHTTEQGQVSQNDSDYHVEYFSLMTHSLGDQPDRLDGLNESIDRLRRQLGENKFKETLNEKSTEFLARLKAAGELNEGLEYDEKDPESFVAAIRAACDEALCESVPNKIATELFYNCMYAYIRAWLVCSIHYGRSTQYSNSLPIDSIFYQDPNRKQKYVIALKSLKRKFSRQPTDKFLKTKESRKVVDKYMTELITLIEQKNPKEVQHLNRHADPRII
ncbi:hypothetical protein [Iningainema tapete]|uniref:Uncharacterized protein n=1 Tax=Iningainema tapete BLCC-T55 TaxID=2748662 RepID=A0A8J6XI58_9CYAN|nr:hypothetical protein [Iningainema tapete]MBD2770647.1 hypothetical protein [Iningainema tapete BLCC-T55]